MRAQCIHVVYLLSTTSALQYILVLHPRSNTTRTITLYACNDCTWEPESTAPMLSQQTHTTTHTGTHDAMEDGIAGYAASAFPRHLLLRFGKQIRESAAEQLPVSPLSLGRILSLSCSLALLLSCSLALLLSCSLALLLSCSLALLLSRSLALSLSRSLAPSLPRSLALSLSRSLALSLSRSLAPSLSRSLALSLSRSLASRIHTRKARQTSWVYCKGSRRAKREFILT